MVMAAAEATALKQGVHDRLLADIQYISEMSGVPARMIKQSSKGTLSDGLITYLKTFKRAAHEGFANAFLQGKLSKSPEVIMMAMAAVMLRNFIDARVMPLQTVLDNEEAAAKASVVLVPNFMNSYIGKPLASHQLQRLYSTLLDRMVSNKTTILYVQDLSMVEGYYGASIAEFIGHNYNALKE